MWWIRSASLTAVFAAAVGALVGCGGSSNLGNVSGTVSYDGHPVEDGIVKFVSPDGKGAGASGAIKDGKYTAIKIPLGNSKVTISGVKVVGKKKAYNTPDSPEIPLTGELLPAKYNSKSDLTFEVKPGTNEKNWDLPK